MAYENFIVPNIYWEYVLRQRRASFINDYYKRYKNYPSDEILQEVVLTDEEKEKYKRVFYAQYKSTGIVPNEPNTPQEPDAPSIPPVSGGVETETPITPIIPPSSGNIVNDYDEWFTMVYNVTTTKEPTKLFSSGSVTSIGTMKIDGKLTDAVSAHTFDTLGKHEVKVLLKDTTKNGTLTFKYISQLKELSIPSSINSLSSSFLYECGGIEKIYSYAQKAPTISTNLYVGTGPTFYNINKNGILFMPQDSDYTSWFTIYNDVGYRNLKDYNWTKEYMN